MDEQHETERRAMAQALQEAVIDQIQLLIAQANIYDQTLQNSEARMAVSVLASLARQVLRQALDLQDNLRPAVLDSLGLEPALEAFAGQVLRTHGVKLSVAVERCTIPQHIELALYRTVQELVDHAVRRANARTVMIQLRKYGDTLTCTIDEDGTYHETQFNTQRTITQTGGIFTTSRSRYGGVQITVQFQVITPEDITEREMDVLRCLVEGMTNKEIALRLEISPRTVKFHLDNLYSKLNVSTRTEAAVYALNHGWIRR